MNDRQSSGLSTPEAPAPDVSFGHYAAYDQLGNTYNQAGYDSYPAVGHSYADPAFGVAQEAGAAGVPSAYDSGQWAVPQHGTYDSGGYDSGQWTNAGQDVPVTADPWQGSAWDQSGQFNAYGYQVYDTHEHPPDQHGGHEQQHNPQHQQYSPHHDQHHDQQHHDQHHDQQHHDHQQEPQHGGPYEQPAHYVPTQLVEPLHVEQPPVESSLHDLPTQLAPALTEDDLDGLGHTLAAGIPAVPSGADSPDVVPPPRRSANRSRRRAPARRSALLTVAVPSVAVMGVAGIAAASVITTDKEQETSVQAASAEGSAVKPTTVNSQLEKELVSLSAASDNFADRASRGQERIDLKERQETEKKRKAAEAAAKEAARPKFVLPVSQHGLSAYYGQAGVNWMSVHTGIDFPVSYGTPVMAATDGTVRTQWNSAYGNMAIVTAPDGTETWYCHLSSTRLRSGSVKAGEVIAYSGNSGNSTGPHLHFEVRPGGGSSIDPLPWLRSHGLDPT